MGNGQRRMFIAGNWKMNKTVGEALTLVRDLRGMVSMVRDRVEIAVAGRAPLAVGVVGPLHGREVVGTQLGLAVLQEVHVDLAPALLHGALDRRDLRQRLHHGAREQLAELGREVVGVQPPRAAQGARRERVGAGRAADAEIDALIASGVTRTP